MRFARSCDYELWTFERGHAVVLWWKCTNLLCSSYIQVLKERNEFHLCWISLSKEVFLSLCPFMQLEGHLLWESTPSCFWNCTRIRMLTGGAEWERKWRPAASPDLFHVSKYIHLSSNIACSSMKGMKCLFNICTVVQYMSKTEMSFLCPLLAIIRLVTIQ